MFKGRHEFGQRRIDAEAGHARDMPASGSMSPELCFVLVLHMVQTGREGEAAAGKRKLLKQPSFSDLR
jgi:hypothetical protein